MIGEMDWDRYWRFELFRRRADPLDARRWKRDSQRELKKLYPGSPRLLDATAGLGDHTINLAEEGFIVDACDDSEVALAATREALDRAGLRDVPVFRARWEALDRDGRYDVIFHDALHWIDDERDLRAALRGLFRALAPGGALVFFFADEARPSPGAGLEILRWDRDHLAADRIAWAHAVDGTEVTLSIVSQPLPAAIDEHHVYLVRGAADVRVESLTMRRVYRWDWHAIVPVLYDVGFESVRTDHFINVKGHAYAMNRAFKPRR